jgi:ectoine hydroxylase-related dioxygenase (phytanoyl-CoA dioxygenase family)
MDDVDPSTIDDPDVREWADYYRGVFFQRVNLWKTSPDVADLVRAPRFGKLAAQLMDVDAVRLYADQALIKLPWANPTGFHLDQPYWAVTDPRPLTFWIALDDVTMTNGCLFFVPGSHRQERYDNVDIGRKLGDLFQVYPELSEVTPVPCPIPAGGCTIHNGLTAHGAHANMTPRSRRGMTLQVVPDGITYNGQSNVLPPDYAGSLAIGDLLEDEEHIPILWSSSMGADPNSKALA